MSKSSITWYWFNLNNHFCPRHTCLVLTHSGFNANPAGFVGAKQLSGKPNMPACVQFNAHRLQREVFMNINGFLHTSCDSRLHSFYELKAKSMRTTCEWFPSPPKQKNITVSASWLCFIPPIFWLFASTVGMQKIRQEQCQCKTSREGPKPIVY